MSSYYLLSFCKFVSLSIKGGSLAPFSLCLFCKIMFTNRPKISKRSAYPVTRTSHKNFLFFWLKVYYIKVMRFPKVFPEVDTIRLWFDVDGYIKLDDFFNGECQRSIAAFQVELDKNGLPLRDKKGRPIFSCVWENKGLILCVLGGAKCRSQLPICKYKRMNQGKFFR